MPSLWVSIDQRLTGTLISAHSPPFGSVFGRTEAQGEDALLATVGQIVGMSQDQIRVGLRVVARYTNLGTTGHDRPRASRSNAGSSCRMLAPT